jgi:ribosomal protein L37AE/L43A
MNAAVPQCPHCESIELRRQGRTGLWQRHIASRLGYFPWECGQCRHVYMLKLRSSGYRHSLGGPKRATLLSRLLLKDQN